MQLLRLKPFFVGIIANGEDDNGLAGVAEDSQSLDTSPLGRGDKSNYLRGGDKFNYLRIGLTPFMATSMPLIAVNPLGEELN